MSAASDNQIRLERSTMEAPEVRRSVEEPAQALYEASDPDGVPGTNGARLFVNPGFRLRDGR
jgi:hypothetical protein